MLKDEQITEKKSEDGTVVEKKSMLVFVMFYALGLVTYIPQSFYVTANDYWMYKFRDPSATFNDTNTTQKTELQTNFTSSYSIVSSVSLIALILLTAIYINRYSLQKRIVGSISIQLALFIITIIFVWTNTDSWQGGFFVFSLIVAALISGTGACYMLSVFELSARFSSVYLAALISGQAICGILAALLQIFTLAMQTSSKMNAFIYFLIGAVFIFMVEASYVMLLAKSKYFHGQQTVSTEKPDFNRKVVIAVAKKLAGLFLTMLLVQGATVMVHPGVAALVESSGSGNRWREAFFVPVCTFFLHNTFDFVGRECARIWKKPSNLYIIIISGVVRLIFVPMIMFCNVQPRNHLPVAFSEDYVYAIIITVFAFTNGYLMNLTVLKLSSICNPEEMNIAVFMLLLVLVVSLASCSFLSRVLIMLI